MPAGVISSCSTVPASRSLIIAVDEMSEPFRISSTPKVPVTINQADHQPGL